MIANSTTVAHRGWSRFGNTMATSMRAALTAAAFIGMGLTHAAGPTPFSYSGAPVAIPDAADLSGTLPGAEVGASLNVSGMTGTITNVTMSIDGTACSTTIGSTTVGIDHTFVNDLKITLRSPTGTRVLVINNTDGSGNNFCQVVLDDASAGANIQTAVTAQAPFTGSWKPNAPLAGFNGEAANGLWTLLAQDFFSGDTGSIRAWTVTITTLSQAATTTSLSSTLNPSTFGQTVTFNSTVTGAAPTGTVTFKDGAATLCAVPLAAAAASCTTSALTTGSHSITAEYAGDANNLASTSVVTTQVVNASPTTTTLSVNPANPQPGQSVTLTATVTGIAPGGTVTFYDGANIVCNAVAVTTVGNVATATCAAGIPSAGPHIYSASYSGNVNNLASSSASTVGTAASIVPTLSQWTLILLSMLLAAFAFSAFATGRRASRARMPR